MFFGMYKYLPVLDKQHCQFLRLWIIVVKWLPILITIEHFPMTITHKPSALFDFCLTTFTIACNKTFAEIRHCQICKLCTKYWQTFCYEIPNGFSATESQLGFLNKGKKNRLIDLNLSVLEMNYTEFLRMILFFALIMTISQLHIVCRPSQGQGVSKIKWIS